MNISRGGSAQSSGKISNPFVFRVGAVGAGIGVGCGVGVGVGKPLNLGAYGPLGGITQGLSTVTSTLRGLLGPLEKYVKGAVRNHTRSTGGLKLRASTHSARTGAMQKKGIKGGIGCGVGIGYGFGAGLMLKPGVAEESMLSLTKAQGILLNTVVERFNLSGLAKTMEEAGIPGRTRGLDHYPPGINTVLQ
eukprot:1195728-Prorocentrum_minimum.AAC.6